MPRLRVISAVLVAKGKTTIWVGRPLEMGAFSICGAEDVAPAVRPPAVGRVGRFSDDPEQALMATAINVQTTFEMVRLIARSIAFYSSIGPRLEAKFSSPWIFRRQVFPGAKNFAHSDLLRSTHSLACERLYRKRFEPTD